MSENGTQERRPRHTGNGGARARPRGRRADPGDLDALRQLLSDPPYRRDLLIEYLHAIQDHDRCLRPSQLAALAELVGLSQTEVYEVATFYAHFDVVDEHEPAPPPLTLRVCDSLSCQIAGARQLLRDLNESSGDGVRVVRAPCMGRCQHAPTVAVGQFHVDHATTEKVAEAVACGSTAAVVLPYVDLDSYRQQGGYSTLSKCVSGTLSADFVMNTLNDAGLRGLGGAGFPPGRKWQLVRAEPGPRMMAVNADEGEPGTFKDRHHLENNPHTVLEGMLIACWAVDAEKVYFYLRDEYPAIRQLLSSEIAALRSAAIPLADRIELRRGAGAYICGEESAMIESIEGKRGLPRHRPPYVAQCGIHGHPTLVNNVETLYWIRDILEKGADWYAGHGRSGATGLRSYSVSGRVKEPGVKLAPAGISARELIEDHCGGMADGHGFRAYLPGGASGGILPASMADLPLEFGALEAHGCFVGSHALIVLGDQDDLREVALNLMHFFEDESCGQCTPCRVGTRKAATLMSTPNWDTGLLRELAQAMSSASICGLGQAAGNPLLSLLRYFPEELEA